MTNNNSPEKPASYEDGQDIRERSFEFACNVVGFCEKLEEGRRVGRLMVPQLLACSLSFPAMLEEARAAESDKDFISKCSIGLKECRESWTRLRVYHACRIGPEPEGRELVREANELISIVTAIIRNTRRNAAAKKEKSKKNGESGTGRRPARREYAFQIPNS